MNIQEKLPYAMTAIRSIMRHDDAPLEDRARVAEELVAFLGEEVKDAEGRETPERVAQREQDLQLQEAYLAQDGARKRIEELRKRNQKQEQEGEPHGSRTDPDSH
jgi:GTP cyclohydrolase I